MTIAGMMYFGGSAIVSGDSIAAGTVAVTSAGSSMLGYLGIGRAPLSRLVRTNMVSGVCAILCIFATVMYGMHLPVLALLALTSFDTYQGAITNSSNDWNANRGDFENSQNEAERSNDGPVISFFTESWRVDSVSKKNYDTCQLVQLLLFGGELFLALICAVDGGPITILSMIILMVCAGLFSFF